jgi:hypothetical protein
MTKFSTKAGDGLFAAIAIVGLYALLSGTLDILDYFRGRYFHQRDLGGPYGFSVLWTRLLPGLFLLGTCRWLTSLFEIGNSVAGQYRLRTSEYFRVALIVAALYLTVFGSFELLYGLYKYTAAPSEMSNSANLAKLEAAHNLTAGASRLVVAAPLLLVNFVLRRGDRRSDAALPTSLAR